MKPGDRIAYTAKFLRQIGGRYEEGQRRGTFLGPHPRLKKFVYVRWDDEDLSDYTDDPEYQESVRENGQMVLAVNIAKVGSVRFGDCHA